MKKKQLTYRLFSFVFLLVIGGSMYFQTQTTFDKETKKENVEKEQESKTVVLEAASDLLLPSSVVVNHLQKLVLFELPNLQSEAVYERIDHNSIALTTFFVKLFNRTIATKAP